MLEMSITYPHFLIGEEMGGNGDAAEKIVCLLYVCLKALARNLRDMRLISSGCKMKCMSVRCKCCTAILNCTPTCRCVVK